MKSSMSLVPMFITALAARVSEPRQLTEEDIKVNANLQIENLSTQKNFSEHSNIEKQILRHLPKGAIRDKGAWRDALLMQGTQWCGQGWRAGSVLELGGYAGADRCCRHHDLGCPLSISPGVTEYGLTNTRFHDVMHCSCDERFRSCLKMARTQAADMVGKLFFDIINIPCFVFSKQRVCIRRNWWGQCTEEEDKVTAIWRQPLTY